MKKANFLLFFLITIFLAGISSFSQTNERSTYKIPEKLNDGWEVASLESVGISTAAIELISEEILSDERMELIYSMLIVKDGKLVHEGYFHGHQRNSLFWLASITKAVSSTLVGIAIDKEFIKSADVSIASLLPQYTGYFKGPKKKDIELKHLMTMTSGLDWNEQTSYNSLVNSEFQMVDSEDWIKYVLSKQVKDTPGTKFYYNTGGIHLLSAIIKSTTGLLANDFARKYLFEPLGIYAYQWVTDSTGYQCTGGTDGGLGIRTRDLAKIGWLFLKDGTWKGKRVISKEWIEEATEKINQRGRGNNYYGYNWSPGSMNLNGKSYEYIAAFGYGGQTLYLIPDKELIIAFTCELTDRNTYVTIPVRKTFDAIFQDIN